MRFSILSVIPSSTLVPHRITKPNNDKIIKGPKQFTGLDQDWAWKTWGNRPRPVMNAWALARALVDTICEVYYKDFADRKQNKTLLKKIFSSVLWSMLRKSILTSLIFIKCSTIFFKNLACSSPLCDNWRYANIDVLASAVWELHVIPRKGWIYFSGWRKKHMF